MDLAACQHTIHGSTIVGRLYTYPSSSMSGLTPPPSSSCPKSRGVGWLRFTFAVGEGDSTLLDSQDRLGFCLWCFVHWTRPTSCLLVFQHSSVYLKLFCMLSYGIVACSLFSPSLDILTALHHQKNALIVLTHENPSCSIVIMFFFDVFIVDTVPC